jgi:glutathione S-transferase
MATPAVKVYGWAISPVVSRALLALEEAGIDYELVPMNRQAGDQHRPEHLARNVRTSLPRSTMNLVVSHSLHSSAIAGFAD